MASETVCNGNSNDTSYHNGRAVDENDALGNTRFPTAQFTAAMATDRNEPYYNMGHEKRGVAVILNHEKFTAPGVKQRTGTGVDCKKLAEELKRLHFDVEVYHDLTYNNIMSQIENLANRDHSKNDCFILAVLSHGERDVIYAHDHFYKAELLWNAFTADKVSTLAGKPKLFFIQACQGDQLDPGVTVQKTETDGVACSYRIPTHADFLIAYSTVPGYYSWRNIAEGAWFIQSLIEELKSNGFTHDILTIMTMVSQRVALNYESNTPQMLSMHGQKQIPCVVSMLTRLVKFTKKRRYYSWRNTTRGSWFIQSLCEELRQNGFHLDLLTLLTFVNRRVAINFESNTPDIPHMHAQKQIPCVTSMLIRLVKFTNRN